MHPMTSYNPIKGITSKIWLQAKMTYWKIKFVAADFWR